jgi:pimeloyl-ACP methyl ester carboxylesterase
MVPTRHIRHSLCCLILFVTLGGGAAVRAAQPMDAAVDTVAEVVRLPLAEGVLDVGELAGALAEQVGLDGRRVSDQIDWRIDVQGKLGRAQLFMLRRATREIMAVELTDEALVVTFDRSKLRRQSEAVRNTLERMLAERFPDAAGAMHERSGLIIHDGTETSRLGPDGMQEMPSRRVVLLAHGLDDPNRVWQTLIPILTSADITVAELRYPDDQAIHTSAAFAASQLRLLRTAGVEQIVMIGHSMGGLVCRDVLTRESCYAGDATGGDRYPEVLRLVLVGTPNHGSELARLRFAAEIRDQIVEHLSGEGLLFGSVIDGTGEAKADLLPGSEFLEALNRRPLPRGLPITIIAGSASPVTPERIAPLLTRLHDTDDPRAKEAADWLEQQVASVMDGVGDGLVPIASTRLEGVTDHVVLPGNHLTIVRNVRATSSRIPPAVPVIMARLASDGLIPGRAASDEDQDEEPAGE